MRHPSRALFVAVLTAIALAGCGGGKSSSQNAAQPTTEAQRETAALPGATIAPVPRSVHCAGQKPVWVNLKRKVYHKFGDPYYGRSHNGEYLCESDAQAKGFHAAGTMRHHRRHRGGTTNDSGTTNDNNGSDDNGSDNSAP